MSMEIDEWECSKQEQKAPLGRICALKVAAATRNTPLPIVIYQSRVSKVMATRQAVALCYAMGKGYG